jgi:hypothetical protein
VFESASLFVRKQIYADETSAATQAFIRQRRDIRREPKTQVADFEEYTRLYYESWGEPAIRWLLSTLPSLIDLKGDGLPDKVFRKDGAVWLRLKHGRAGCPTRADVRRRCQDGPAARALVRLASQVPP